MNRDKEYYEKQYDGIIIPEELIGTHPKATIQKRNCWMVDHAELLIAFVSRDFGRAYETLIYARRVNTLRIINIAEELP